MRKQINDFNDAPLDESGSMKRSAESLHEAGHAVAAIVCGYRVNSIDIIPQVVPGTGGQMGKAGAELQLPTLETITGRGEEAVCGILVTLLSGYLAERGVNASAQLEQNHENSDGGRAMKFLAFAIAPPFTQNEQVVTRVDQDQFRDIWKRAEDKAAILLETHAAAVGALANLLETKGRLSGVEIERCVRPMLGWQMADDS